MDKISGSEPLDLGPIPNGGSNKKKIMSSLFREGSRISYKGIKGTVIRITETYRKNVLVVKVSELPKPNPFPDRRVETIGLFEYPDGKLEFMSIID
jgi:hypothetical protein